MVIHTIGFTKKSAEHFFEALKSSRATTLVDVRLNNVSQLAGFAKREDLKYFLGKICNMNYVHMRDLAPTQDLLERYKKVTHDWPAYERDFLRLMEQRAIATSIPRFMLDGAVLLCSEHEPQHCHRRLVAEYLAHHWGGVDINHIR